MDACDIGRTAMTRIKRKLLVSIVLCTVCGLTTYAQVDGRITIKGSDKAISGKIRWSPAEKAYEVVRQDTGRSTRVPLRNVKRLRVSRPSGLDAAVKKVRDKSYDGPHIEELRKIVSVYQMLEHDMRAAAYLAEAQLATGNARQAAATCRKVKENRTTLELSGEFVRVYWRTLLEEQNYTVLQQEIKETIEQGSRPAAAVAQLMRGDIDMRKGMFEKALVDGYLRTVILFDDVSTVQPEALYKASQCFDELGDSINAEKMRKKLLAAYPDSNYSKNIQTGG
jgi:tetratricopeptide (TPR) repeat protein